jgi:cytochrome c biogenesis protein CcdA
MALLGALTPLVQRRNGYRHWLIAATAYTIAGSISSGITGFAIGEIGSWWITAKLDRLFLALVLPALAIISAARDLGLVRFPVPERKVQTESVWMDQFGPLQAAVMWGFHLGFGFTTRVMYMGFWLLLVSIVALRSATWGAALMGIYWLGRAVPVWLAPLHVSSAEDSVGTVIMSRALTSRPLFRMLQIIGDITLATTLFSMHGSW